MSFALYSGAVSVWLIHHQWPARLLLKIATRSLTLVETPCIEPDDQHRDQCATRLLKSNGHKEFTTNNSRSRYEKQRVATFVDVVGTCVVCDLATLSESVFIHCYH
jgi:hypothetical protein